MSDPDARKRGLSTERLRRGVPTAVALGILVLGIVDLASALTPERAARLHALRTVVPLEVAQAASAFTAVAGVLLVMLGLGLRRRKRRAWRAAVVLLAISTVLHLVKGIDYEEATVTGLGVVALLALSRQFYAAGDPRTRWRAPVAFVTMLIVSFCLGQALLTLRHHRVVGHPSWGARTVEVLGGLVGINGPVQFRSPAAADNVYDILLALGAVTLVLPVYLALRPSEPVAHLDADAETRVRDLLARNGERDSLAYFALRRDRAVIFSPTGKAAVSYRVVSGVMLAAGDPLGDPEAWPGAIAEFVAEARRHAWVPAVMGCSERGGDVWVREAQLRALELGDEAIVDVCDFSLDGRAMRNVRQMVARVERAGYKTHVQRVADMPPGEIETVRRQAALWRGGDVERGFSMALGRFGEPGDEQCVAVTAYKDDALAALLHFVPWGTDGLSLELMRRDRAADPGLNELMIVTTLRAASDLGVRRVSLNFAAFRSALERGARLGAGPVLRGWRGLLLFVSRWFQIESLYRFNAKFRPYWEPRYICYPAARDLPRVALAALEAEAFLVTPSQYLAHRRARRLLVR